MKEPRLEDFGLEENDFLLHKIQEERYNEAIKNANIEKDKNLKISMIVLVIICAIVGIILAIRFKDSYWFLYLICPFGFVLMIYPFWSGLLDEGISQTKKDALKLKYIDISLEKSISYYKKAIVQYEIYLEKCQKDFWINLNGYEFEKEIANLLKNLGCKVLVTPKTRDGGVDIIVYHGEQKIAVQCKHHKQKVGPNDTRAFQSVVYNQNFSHGIFVSLNGFSSAAIIEVQNGKQNIELWTLDNLLHLQKQTS